MPLTPTELKKIKVIGAVVFTCGLAAYIAKIIPHAVVDNAEFWFLIGLHLLIFGLTYRYLTPWALDKAKYRIRLLVLTFIVQSLVLLALLVAVSMIFGDLTWSAESDWSISNFWEVSLPFLLPQSLGFMAYMLQDGLNGWYKAAELKVHNEQLYLELKGLEFQVYQQQLTPHFMFNSLTTIRRLMRDSPTDATTTLNTAIDILKFYLTNHKKGFVSFIDELQQVDNLVEIYRRRIGRKLFLEYDIDSWILLNCNIPMMILLNLIENCCQYGDLTDRNRPATVEISRLTSGQLHMRVFNFVAPVPLEEVQRGNNQLERIREGLQLLDPTNDLHVEKSTTTFCVKIILNHTPLEEQG